MNNENVEIIVWNWLDKRKVAEKQKLRVYFYKFRKRRASREREEGDLKRSIWSQVREYAFE